MNLTADLYLNLICGGAAKLSAHRQEINDLNVFPIPDGDTGDNMYMTIEAGTRGSGGSLGEMAASVSSGMLLGARGNSGVILSRIFAGIAKGFKGLGQAGVREFSHAMKCGVEEAYKAVSQPVEGTILTVLREGVDAASGASSLEEFFDLITVAMDRSLQHTPELLDVLKKAGVVDSGGAGLLCIVEGMKDALHGRSPIAVGDDATNVIPGEASVSPAKVDFSAFTEDSELEFGYCTEFLLRLQRSKVDLDSFDESVIREWLASQGDSLVFFRDGSIIKVHVHTKDPGAILTRCREWGEYLTVKVENMTLQHHENNMDKRFKRSRKPLGIVVVASGEGLCRTFREMGADAVIEGGQTMNPPVESFMKAFDETNADTILVFPNNSNIILTANQSAAMYNESRVEVIPTRTPGEGYFAMASLDAELPADQLKQSLTQAAEAVTTGFVSQAVRDSGEVKEGQWIGFSGKDILCQASDAGSAALELAGKLDAGSADILLVVAGENATQEASAALQDSLQNQFPMAETILLQGDQPVYDYILVIC